MNTLICVYIVQFVHVLRCGVFKSCLSSLIVFFLLKSVLLKQRQFSWPPLVKILQLRESIFLESEDEKQEYKNGGEC